MTSERSAEGVGPYRDNSECGVWNWGKRKRIATPVRALARNDRLLVKGAVCKNRERREPIGFAALFVMRGIQNFSSNL